MRALPLRAAAKTATRSGSWNSSWKRPRASSPAPSSPRSAAARSVLYAWSRPPSASSAARRSRTSARRRRVSTGSAGSGADRLAGRAAEPRLLHGPRLVEAPDRRGPWGPGEARGILLRLGDDLEHRLHEGVESLERLGLGRLDHQRLLHDQRKVDRGWVDAEVHEALG